MCEWNSGEEPHIWGKKNPTQNKNIRERHQTEGEMLSQNPLGSFAGCWGALVGAAEDLQFGLWVHSRKAEGSRLQIRHPMCCAADQLPWTLPCASTQDLPEG